MKRMFHDYRSALFTLIIVALCACASVAHAQTQPWNTNVVPFDAPTTCTTGEPVASCPVTGYRIERAASATGVYTALASIGTTATSYMHTGAAAGVNCYRAFALSAQGDSPASNVMCKTNVKPVGPSSAPVLRVIDSVAFNLHMDGRKLILGDVVGKAMLGALCGSADVIKNYGTVARSNVKLAVPQPDGAPLMARCDPI